MTAPAPLARLGLCHGRVEQDLVWLWLANTVAIMSAVSFSVGVYIFPWSFGTLNSDVASSMDDCFSKPVSRKTKNSFLSQLARYTSSLEVNNWPSPWKKNALTVWCLGHPVGIIFSRKVRIVPFHGTGSFLFIVIHFSLPQIRPLRPQSAQMILQNKTFSAVTFGPHCSGEVTWWGNYRDHFQGNL